MTGASGQRIAIAVGITAIALIVAAAILSVLPWRPQPTSPPTPPPILPAVTKPIPRRPVPSPPQPPSPPSSSSFPISVGQLRFHRALAYDGSGLATSNVTEGVLGATSMVPPTTASECIAHGASLGGTFYADAHVSPTMAVDAATGAISLYYESGLWSADESTARVMVARLRPDVPVAPGHYYLESAHGRIDGGAATQCDLAGWDRVMGKVAAGNVLVVSVWREADATRAFASLVSLTPMVDSPVRWTSPTLFAMGHDERPLGLWQSTVAPTMHYHLVTMSAADGRVLYRRSIDGGATFPDAAHLLYTPTATVVDVQWRDATFDAYEVGLTLSDGRRFTVVTANGGIDWALMEASMAHAASDRLPALVDSYRQPPGWNLTLTGSIDLTAALAADLGGQGDDGVVYGPDVALVSARTCTAAALTPTCFSNRPALSVCTPTAAELASSCRIVRGRHRVVRDAVTQATWVDAVIRRAMTTAAGHRLVLLEQVAESTAAGFFINVELAAFNASTGAPLNGSPFRLAQYNARHLPRGGPPHWSWTTGAAATSTAIVVDAWSGHVFVTYALPYAEGNETPLPSTPPAAVVVDATPRSYVVVSELALLP